MPNKEKIRIMTYNIASGLDNRSPRVKCHANAADEISKYSPDIVGLNEVGNELPKGMTSHAGYIAEKCCMNYYFARAIYTGAGNEYGNALLSRYPITNARTVMIPDPETHDEDAYYETRCMLVADIAFGDGVTVIVSHFGLAKSEEQNAVAAVAAEIDDVNKPIIVMGDFNMTPDNPILKPLYARLNEVGRILKNEQYTFPSDAPNIKIDYIFSSNQFEIQEMLIPSTLSSDHVPIIADYNFIV